MYRALYEGTVLAQSNDVKIVENNPYFPPDSINNDLFSKSELHTTCPWKGQADYLNLKTEEGLVRDVAWIYPNPLPDALQIRGHVAFYSPPVIIEKID